MGDSLGVGAVQCAGAACGGDVVRPGDGVVRGGHGGVDVTETEVGFGEPGQVDGVAAGEGAVVRLLAGSAEGDEELHVLSQAPLHWTFQVRLTWL